MRKFNVKTKDNKYFGGKEIQIISHFNSNEIKCNTNIGIKLLTGSIIGFVNGFWGGGGGMLCVPLLLNIIKLPEKKAHATTLLIMLPLSIVSLIVYILKGNLPLIESSQIGIGFVIGGVLGAYLLKKISNLWLGIVFSLIIIVSGIKMFL